MVEKAPNAAKWVHIRNFPPELFLINLQSLDDMQVGWASGQKFLGPINQHDGRQQILKIGAHLMR